MEEPDFFNEYIEFLESYKWVGVKDLSEKFEISERTIFKWLKDGKIQGIKWKNRRLINSVSVLVYLMEKKCIEINRIHDREIKRELELRDYQYLKY